jgi:soluble cytochrome b562
MKTVVIAGLLITGLAAQVFAESSLVYEMAALDQVLIPVASLSNQGKLEATKTAVTRLQSQWTIFFASAQDAFPGDREWTRGLETVKESIAEAAQAAQEGNLPKIHEVLEGVRITFEELREKRNIHYYLDGFSKYRIVRDKTIAILTGKKASDLTEADIRFVSSMVPVLKSTWASVQAADLNAELFHFDAAKIAEIRSAMDSVRKDIAKLESVAPGGTRDQIFEALNRLKPSLTKAFLMFGKF